MGGRPRAQRRRLVRAGCALWLTAASGLAQAAVVHYCDRPAEASVRQQDRLLRVAALVKAELEASGRGLALVARSGLDLGRFGVRYSHAGFGLRASPNTPWSVRQLYYACDEQRPRLFDQGLAGFLLGSDDAAPGYLSIVLLPEAESAAVERTVLDNRRALQLLAPAYSANAHPFSLRYQNCNQWVVELLALAQGATADGGGASGESPAVDDVRRGAQHWLQRQGYEPARIDVHNPLLMLAAAFVPWLHTDDHPPQDLERRMISVSLPQSIERFVRERMPGARRIELCHTERHAVLRRGWTPIDDACRPMPGDTVVTLDD